MAWLHSDKFEHPQFDCIIFGNMHIVSEPGKLWSYGVARKSQLPFFS
jgi:hypothetical protein